MSEHLTPKLTGAVVAAQVYGTVLLSIARSELLLDQRDVFSPFGFLACQIPGGVLTAATLRFGRSPFDVRFFILTMVAVFFALFVVVGAWDGAFTCWNCPDGDASRGTYLILGAFLSAILIVGSLVAMATVGVVASVAVSHFAKG